jgi:hypothetical protein
VYGKIQREKSLDMADASFDHVAGIEQEFIGQRQGQGFHVLAQFGQPHQAAFEQGRRQLFAEIALVAEELSGETVCELFHRLTIMDIAGVSLTATISLRRLNPGGSLKPKNQPMLVLPRRLWWRRFCAGHGGNCADGQRHRINAINAGSAYPGLSKKHGSGINTRGWRPQTVHNRASLENSGAAPRL